MKNLILIDSFKMKFVATAPQLIGDCITDEKNQKDDRYSANNEQGYSITLEYDYDDYEIEVRVSKEE